MLEWIVSSNVLAWGLPAKTVRDIRRRFSEDLFHRAFSSRLLRLTLQGPLEGEVKLFRMTLW